VPTLQSLYRQLKQRLGQSGVENADLEARYILEHRAHIKASDLITAPEQDIEDNIAVHIYKDVEERIQGKPLSKIHGYREFWGRNFIVSEDTLDPRPDTETLIETALSKYENSSPNTIIDLGTGTGCILITLLKEYPQSRGIGIDVSSAAIKIARQNAEKHAVELRAEFIESSWLDNVAESVFDSRDILIVSNPPYVKSSMIPKLSIEVQNHDPILALDGGKSGLDEYKKILFQIKNKINHPVNILFEIGYDQQESLVRIVEQSGFVVNAVHRDLLGNPRVVDISSGDK